VIARRILAVGSSLVGAGLVLLGVAACSGDDTTPDCTSPGTNCGPEVLDGAADVTGVDGAPSPDTGPAPDTGTHDTGVDSGADVHSDVHVDAHDAASPTDAHDAADGKG
jgi:hypothetical protein